MCRQTVGLLPFKAIVNCTAIIYKYFFQDSALSSFAVCPSKSGIARLFGNSVNNFLKNYISFLIEIACKFGMF